MDYCTRNQDAVVSLTATRPTAFTGRKWVRWTRRMKAEFLDALAARCSVLHAAAAIGVDPVSVYALRRRDPAFLAEWELALEQGYQMIETLLVGHVLAGGAADGVIDDGDVSLKIDVDLAFRLLNAHRAAKTGEERVKRKGPPLGRASNAETDAAILKKLTALEKRRSAQ